MPPGPDPVTEYLAGAAVYLTAALTVVCATIWLGRTLGWWR